MCVCECGLCAYTFSSLICNACPNKQGSSPCLESMCVVIGSGVLLLVVIAYLIGKFPGRKQEDVVFRDHLTKQHQKGNKLDTLSVLCIHTSLYI